MQSIFESIHKLPMYGFFVFYYRIHYSEYVRAKAHSFFFAVPRPKGRG